MENNIRSALHRGLQYTIGKRSPDGLWRDFETLAGTSDQWVSSYVLNSLHSLADLFSPLHHTQKKLIELQRMNGGWGYNEYVPSDADSTAWALLSFSGLPEWKPSAIYRGLRYL